MGIHLFSTAVLLLSQSKTQTLPSTMSLCSLPEEYLNSMAAFSDQIKISNIIDKSLLPDENLQSQQIQRNNFKQPESRKLCLSLSKTLKTKVSGEKCNSSAASQCKATTDQPSCYMPDKANKVDRKIHSRQGRFSWQEESFLSNVTWCTSNKSH